MIKQQLIRLSKRWQGWLALAVTISLRDGFRQEYVLESPVTHLFNNR